MLVVKIIKLVFNYAICTLKIFRAFNFRTLTSTRRNFFGGLLTLDAYNKRM